MSQPSSTADADRVPALRSVSRRAALQSVSRRAALAAGALALSGTAGCLDSVRAALDPHTHHSDATLGDPPTPWPTLCHDARRTGARASATTLPASPTVERVGPAGEFTGGTPVVASDTVVSADWKGRNAEPTSQFVALDVDDPTPDGEPEVRWRDTREKGLATPTVVGETAVLVGAGLTRAVDRRTGESHWEYATGTASGAPTVVADTVYVSGERLVALDAVTGERRWVADDVPTWAGGAAATADTVFLDADDEDAAALYALDPADGSVLWETPLDAGTYIPPVVGDDVVVLTESNSVLRGIDRASGQQRWVSHVLEHPSQTGPAVADGRAFVVDDGVDSLYAVDVATGKPLWRTSLGVTVDHLPAVGGDTVYAFGYDGERGGHTLVALDATTGEVGREVAVGFDPGRGVALADDAVYAYGERERPGVWRVG